MDSITDRLKKRFKEAVAALERALALKDLPEEAERDAVLLRFELAAELMPKLLRRILSDRGADVALPKDVVREARAGEIVDETTAFALLQAIDDRNRMVHDYSEEFAEALLGRVRRDYASALRAVADSE